MLAKLEREQYLQLSAKDSEFGVVFLHGLGASGYDFLPWIQDNFSDANISWRLPHAASRPVTWLNQQVVPAWYDLFEASTRSKEDLPGLAAAAELVYEQVAALNSLGLANSQIFIMGFSQGAALAMYAGLRFTDSLAGIAAFSGYLPAKNSMSCTCKQQVWLSHGDADQVLPLEFHHASHTGLSELDNVILTDKIFPGMAHELNVNCSNEFKVWFASRRANAS